MVTITNEKLRELQKDFAAVGIAIEPGDGGGYLMWKDTLSDASDWYPYPDDLPDISVDDLRACLHWRLYGVKIEQDDKGYFQWTEIDDQGEEGGFSPRFTTFQTCLADLEASYGPLAEQGVRNRIRGLVRSTLFGKGGVMNEVLETAPSFANNYNLPEGFILEQDNEDDWLLFAPSDVIIYTEPGEPLLIGKCDTETEAAEMAHRMIASHRVQMAMRSREGDQRAIFKATVEMFIVAESSTEASDAVGEILRDNLRSFNDNSCLIDWRFARRYQIGEQYEDQFVQIDPALATQQEISELEYKIDGSPND